MVRIRELVSICLLVSLAGAHPGEDIEQELWERKQALADPQRRTVEDCHGELEASGYFKRELARRLERVNSLRTENGVSPRKADEFHHA
jgi:hypothetical protein